MIVDVYVFEIVARYFAHTSHRLKCIAVVKATTIDTSRFRQQEKRWRHLLVELTSMRKCVEYQKIERYEMAGTVQVAGYVNNFYLNQKYMLQYIACIEVASKIFTV